MWLCSNGQLHCFSDHFRCYFQMSQEFFKLSVLVFGNFCVFVSFYLTRSCNIYVEAKNVFGLCWCDTLIIVAVTYLCKSV